MGKKLTQCIFIERSNLIHNNMYDYSLVEYKNVRTKVSIICSIHGVFQQTPREHMKGQKCIKCRTNYRKPISKSTFINNANNIHDYFYDYSLVQYSGNKTKVSIICPIHGVFRQTPNNHIRNHGCPKCAKISMKNKLKKCKNEFIEQSNKKHHKFYDYSLVDYINNKTKIKIICPKHGIFQQTPFDHTKGCGCPKCNESKGEKEIRIFLENNNINYFLQKEFDACKYKRNLKFDFFLPDYNLCIEFDGIQHFESINYFGGEKTLKKQKIKDNIKNNYCKDNNINLLRIKYDEKISEILNTYL